MNFSNRLRTLRETCNMRQKQLATQLNLKPNAISKYESETAQPSIQTVVLIAKIFDVNTDYLLGVSEIKKISQKNLFSPKESEFVQKYRKLTNINKIRVDERMRALLDIQESES